MATREQVLAALRETDDYARAAASLGIPPGQAYLIVTGFAADGSGGMAPEDRRREGFLAESNHLLHGAPDGPARSRTTMSFVLDRVEADTPMREAAQRRDAMAGEPQDDGEATTEVTTVLGRDHSRVKALLEQLQAIPGRSKGGTERHVSRRASIVDLITVELSGHEALEEQHLWPVVRRALPAGEEVAEMALAQEQEGKQTLALLGKLGEQSGDFDSLVERLALLLRRHVAHEDRVFLELRASLPQSEREALGAKVASQRTKAPTRPHPHGPSSPPALTVAGPGAAALDHARDALGRRRGPAGREPHRQRTGPSRRRGRAFVSGPAPRRLRDWPALRQLRENDRFGRGAAAKSGRSARLSPRTASADRLVKSVCPYCAVGCGQNVYVKAGRVVQIEGDPDSPVSRGRLCPKGSASLQLTSGPFRQYQVLYRRPYGTQWEPISLDRAMEMVADRVVATRRDTWEWEANGARTRRTLGIASLGGATLDNEENYLIKKLLTALGIIQVENQARV